MKTLALGLGLWAIGSPLTAMAADDTDVEARTVEAETNLRKLAAAQQRYFQDKESYTTRAQMLRFAPARGNRYTYFLAPRGPAQDRSRAIIDSNALNVMVVPVDRFKHPNARYYGTARETGCPVTPGQTPDGQSYGLGVTDREGNHAYLILAAGNIDDDPELDCWTVASTDRQLPDGKTIPAGVPYRERSDAGGSGARASGPVSTAVETARADIANLLAAARLWTVGRSSAPTSIAQLYQADQATGGKLPKNDPWGGTYTLIRAVEHVVIFSAGPDKRVGTGDDVALVAGM